MKVLLLEDDQDASMMLSLALQQFDRRYDFVFAASLSDALARLETETVDIALIDLGLPDASDSEAALALRANHPHVPLVALTGRRFDDLAVTLTRRGIQDFLRKGDATPQRIHEVLQLAIERHRQEAALRRQAMHDVLTGVLNRAHLLEQLRKATDRAVRQGVMGAVVSIDIDDFKGVNDRFGHHTGDAVLIELASRLTKTLRLGDTVYRVGGDEFIVIAEGLHAPADAEALTAHVQDAVQFCVDGREEAVAITASIGLALFPTEAEDPATLLRLSDDAMYSAKRTRKQAFTAGDGAVAGDTVAAGGLLD